MSHVATHPIQFLAPKLISLAGALLYAHWALGQDYPNQPIRIVTASAPGGSGDLVARLIAQGITGSLGQPLVVDNRGSAIAAGPLVARANANGYTLLSIGNSLWLSPLWQENVPYDPIRDFSPVSMTHKVPLIVAVHPSLPVRSIAELISLAKVRPGQLNLASAATGSAPQLAAELFKATSATNMVSVPYKGSGGSMTAIVSGEVQVTFASPPAVLPVAKSGRLRALAVTSAQPSALAPGLPTVAASGLPGYESEVTSGLLVPTGTPSAIVTKINIATVRFLTSAEGKDRFLSAGVEPAPSSPQDFATAISAEITRIGNVIRNSRINGQSTP